MYTIYINDRVLYSPLLCNEGYIIFSPALKLSLNKAGSFSFTIPTSNPEYGNIQKLKTVIKVYSDSEMIFEGRVLHDEANYYLMKQVYCEGELSYLLDSIVRPYSYTGSIKKLFTKLIDEHNNQVDSEKKFSVGNITVKAKASTGNITRSTSLYPNTFDELTEKFPNSMLGGYLKIRHENGNRYLDYLEESGPISSQNIEFGNNLLDFSEYVSADEVFTVLIPLGEKNENEEYLTIKEVNNGKDYIEDETGVKLFGRICKKVEWSETKTADTLLKNAKEYLESGVQMAITLTVNALDLHLLNVDTESIHIGDMVNVISEPHGLDSLFQCTSITLDLSEPNSSEYTFGYAYSSLADRIQSDITTKQSGASTTENTGTYIYWT
jgi:phage minor structural protein